MRCTLHRDLKFLCRTIEKLCKFNNEVRIITSEDDLRFEAMKGEHCLGQLIIRKDHFDYWDPSSPADVHLKSKSLKVVFRNSSYITKAVQRMEIWIENDQNLALFKISPTQYDEKVIKVPVVTVFQATQIPILDLSSYAVHIISDTKTWLSGLKNFPGSIELVTTRFSSKRVKMETGDEKSEAPIMTKFNFHLEEFKFWEIQEDMVCTYALHPVLDFLQIWDPKFHSIDSYYDPRDQIPVIFKLNEQDFEANLILAKASKNHDPDLSSDDDGDAVSISNTTSFSRASLTPQVAPSSSRQDPKNRFIYRADPSLNQTRDLFQSSGIPRSTGLSSAPLSTLPSNTASHVVTSVGDDEFDDDGLDDIPTHTLTQVIGAGGDEFDDSDQDMDAINQSVQAFSQNGLTNQFSDVPVETFGAPVHQSTQSGEGPDERMSGSGSFSTSFMNNNFIHDLSMNLNSSAKFEQQRRFLGLQESLREPSQEYEILAPDSDDE